jgi:dipeptidyl aminopeptidase/acylaminoacyl peptidase
MFRKSTLQAAIVLAIFGCAAAHAQVSNPAKYFARDPDYGSPTMSPSGDYVAADTPDGDNRALAMIKVVGAPERNLFRFKGNTDRFENIVKKLPIGVTWSDDNHLVVFEGYDYGTFGSKSISGNVYATSADAKEQVQLFGYINDDINRRGRLKDEGIPYLMDVVEGSKGQALFYFQPWVTGNSDRVTRVYSVDTHTGAREQVEHFDDAVAVTADNTGKARVNYRYDLNGLQVVQYRPTPDSAWLPMPDSLKGRSIDVWMFEPDNNTAYATVSEKGEPAQLYKVNFSAGTRERIGGQPNQDIAHYQRAGRAGPPIVLSYDAGKPKIDYLDPKSPWAQLHAGLLKAFPGNMVTFLDVSRDDKKVLFATWSDRNPGTYYLLDRTTNKPTLLFKMYEDWDESSMSPMLPLEFKNRGGDSINAFLTVPQGKEGAHALVVLPHGGPFGISDSWGYDREAQFLASLGYAVLQVNYRGSGERGENFEKSGWKQWGTGIQDDIADGVKYVIDQGFADKNKVCIFGISFGGYSAMENPIRNPGMYKCAIGYAGVYDMKQQYQKDDASKQGRAFFARTMGDDATMVEQSPLSHLDKLDVPMLLIHGKADHTADFQQFQLADAALKKAGKTYEVLVKADEGHGFYKPQDREEAMSRIQAFLLKYNPPN